MVASRPPVNVWQPTAAQAYPLAGAPDAANMGYLAAELRGDPDHGITAP
jgi:hypothetical protein